MLVGAAIALTLYLERQNRAALVTFLGFVVAVMLTRSVFHPLWLIVVAASVVPFISRRKHFILACCVAFFIVNLLFVKNREPD